MQISLHPFDVFATPTMNSYQLHSKQAPLVSSTQENGATSASGCQVPGSALRAGSSHKATSSPQARNLQVKQSTSTRPPLYAGSRSRVIPRWGLQNGQPRAFFQGLSNVSRNAVPNAFAVQGSMRPIFTQCPWCATIRTPYDRVLQVVAQQLAALDAALPFQLAPNFIDPAEIERGIPKTGMHRARAGEIDSQGYREGSHDMAEPWGSTRQGKRHARVQGGPRSKRRRLEQDEGRAFEKEGSGDIIQDLIEECRKLDSKK